MVRNIRQTDDNKTINHKRQLNDIFLYIVYSVHYMMCYKEIKIS